MQFIHPFDGDLPSFLNEAYFNIEKLLNETTKNYQKILPYKTLVETQKEIINKKPLPQEWLICF